MDDKRRRKVDILLKAYPRIKEAVLQLKVGKGDDIEICCMLDGRLESIF